jgi:hypothetical protein
LHSEELVGQHILRRPASSETIDIRKESWRELRGAIEVAAITSRLRRAVLGTN